jgi:hypothetical protein
MQDWAITVGTVAKIDNKAAVFFSPPAAFRGLLDD